MGSGFVVGRSRFLILSRSPIVVTRCFSLRHFPETELFMALIDFLAPMWYQAGRALSILIALHVRLYFLDILSILLMSSGSLLGPLVLTLHVCRKLFICDSL